MNPLEESHYYRTMDDYKELMMTEQDKQGAEREALEAWMTIAWNRADSVLNAGPMDVDLMRNARSQQKLIEIARAALRAEQQGQEPVAWVHDGTSQVFFTAKDAEQYRDAEQRFARAELAITPLYSRPAPASQPVGEAVAQIDMQAANAIIAKHFPDDPANAVRAHAAVVELAGILAPSVAQAGLSENAAMDVALRIIANLEDRAGVLDGVDDDTKADIADEIAVAILARSGQPAQEGNHG